MKKVYLHNNWQLKGDRVGVVPATVPGCVHTDLINCGQIKDLFWRDNNKQYSWIENCDFSYSCSFDAEECETASLVFEGLDTYSDMFLNGKKIGSTDDMFIEYRFDVSDIIKKCDNQLEVKFRSPVKEVENEPLCEGAFTKERIRTRRIQCTYGWDWVDRFVTCGIYRPVYIEYGNDMCVDNVYVFTENIDKYSAQIYTEIELKNYSDGGLVKIEILSPQGDSVCSTEVYSKESKIVRRFDIEDAQLWYPSGYGEHPLYTLRVRINDNIFTENFGIRTIKVLQLPDKEGSDYYNRSKELQSGKFVKDFDKNEKYSGFQVIVNSQRIFCCGANWVPCEPFPSAETDEKINNIISAAKKMNVNMIRVWGGGGFEKRHFYDLCDREGILVTQDFLMACGAYPEKEQWFIEKLKKEAEYAVKYLRNHPCLAWWSGDNENATMGNDIMENYRGREAALTAIAPMVYTYDRGRPFFVSSPYGGNLYASSTVGTTHNTIYVDKMYDYFYNQNCDDYKEFFEQFKARFIAEEPTFGAVSRNSILRFLSETDLEDSDEEMLRYHSKGNPDLKYELYDCVAAFALKVLGAAKNSKDRYFKYKYIQYEWVRIIFENHRRNIGYCNGLIFWMLNDCWPASMGWSFIDYFCIPKASFYAFKRCASKCVVSVIKKDNGYSAVLSNACDKPINAKAKAYLFEKSKGMQIAEEYEFNMSVDEYSSEFAELPWKHNEDHIVICEIKTDCGKDRSFYKDGNLAINDCSDCVKVISHTDTSISLASDKYIHVLELEGDYIFSNNYFSMLPGEEVTITYKNSNNIFDSEVTVTAYTLQ